MQSQQVFMGWPLQVYQNGVIDMQKITSMTRCAKKEKKNKKQKNKL